MSQMITYAESMQQLKTLSSIGIKEVILSDKRFSRIAKNEDFEALALKAKELKLKVIFEWDVLLTDRELLEAIKTFESLNHKLIDAVRMQDPGVAQFIFEKTDFEMHFIAEMGNHNLSSLKTWESYFGERLTQMVLSNELSKEKLKNYKKELSVKLEILTLGKILLFYSPRKLISPLLDEDRFEDYISAIADSEESPHKGFPIIQNRHGTFMFHLKHLFLWDKLPELRDTGIDIYRVDLRDTKDFNILKKLNDLLLGIGSIDIKSSYPFSVIRGYFQTNKSDVLFKKLKNYRIQRKDDSYIGEVLECQKSSYMALKIAKGKKLHINENIKFINPEGKEIHASVLWIRNSNYEEIPEASSERVALIQYMGGVWPKSQIYKAQGESSLR